MLVLLLESNEWHFKMCSTLEPQDGKIPLNSDLANGGQAFLFAPCGMFPLLAGGMDVGIRRLCQATGHSVM